jgi:hypothetical protein
MTPLLSIILETWSGGKCPVCLLVWTPFQIEARDARVASVEDRVLVCRQCAIERGIRVIREEMRLRR